MPYYRTCDLCGASLDPGEKCTCVQEAKEKAEQEKISKAVNFTIQLLNQGKQKRRKAKV